MPTRTTDAPDTDSRPSAMEQHPGLYAPSRSWTRDQKLHQLHWEPLPRADQRPQQRRVHQGQQRRRARQHQQRGHTQLQWRRRTSWRVQCSLDQRRRRLQTQWSRTRMWRWRILHINKIATYAMQASRCWCATPRTRCWCGTATILNAWSINQMWTAFFFQLKELCFAPDATLQRWCRSRLDRRQKRQSCSAWTTTATRPSSSSSWAWCTPEWVAFEWTAWDERLVDAFRQALQLWRDLPQPAGHLGRWAEPHLCNHWKWWMCQGHHVGADFSCD